MSNDFSNRLRMLREEEEGTATRANERQTEFWSAWVVLRDERLVPTIKRANDEFFDASADVDWQARDGEVVLYVGGRNHGSCLRLTADHRSAKVKLYSHLSGISGARNEQYSPEQLTQTTVEKVVGDFLEQAFVVGRGY